MDHSQWNLFGGFDRLDTVPADEIKSLWWSDKFVDVPIQPIWVTVKIPRDCPAGDYAGKLTVTSRGQTPVVIPVQLNVVGNWALPDPENFKTYVGLVESPETVAAYYKVPMWSDEHWKLLDQTFSLMAQFGTKEIYIPLTGHSLTDNSDAMVRWIKQPDGSYRYDYSIAEKYIDLATKDLKQLRTVCLIVLNCKLRREKGHAVLHRA